MSKTEPLIDLKKVNFNYPSGNILKSLTFSIYPGEFIGLLGPNGSGKSTLVKILVGLLQPSFGAVYSTWHHIGYVPQRATQIDQNFPISVNEVVSLSTENQKETDKALDLTNMLKQKNELFKNLSGGQQQRVLIAKALAGDPELLILDEPTVGIDEESQKDFYKLLAELNQRKITIILVSHDTDIITNEVSRVIYLNHEIIFDDTPIKFIKSKHHQH